MTRLRVACVLMVSSITLLSSDASAQTAVSSPSDVPRPNAAVSQQQGPAQGAQNAVKGTVKRFNIGVQGGVAVNPEMIVGGAYADFGPVFSEALTIRPDVYVAGGEITTEFGFDVDGLYALKWSMGNDWRTYAGAGASFALSHESFETPVDSSGTTTTTTTSATGATTTTTTQDRFDFSDTDFEVGLNLLFGARNPKGAFFEVRATAFGVANVKFLAGFRF